MQLKIALLRSDGPHHCYLEMMLNSSFNLVCVAVEPAKEQTRRLRIRKRWNDWLWRQYHDWRRELFGLNRYREEFFGKKINLADPNEINKITVQNINDASVIELLTAVSPDVVIVIGTSILSKRLLTTAGMVINIHGGLLPFYSGNHCFFFAFYDGRPDLAGSTIHFVDAGVDTGDIIETVTVMTSREDTPESTYCRAEKLAIQRLVDLLKEYEKGKSLPRVPQPAGGRTIRTRDRKLHHDLIYGIRRRVSHFFVKGLIK